MNAHRPGSGRQFQVQNLDRTKMNTEREAGEDYLWSGTLQTSTYCLSRFMNLNFMGIKLEIMCPVFRPHNVAIDSEGLQSCSTAWHTLKASRSCPPLFNDTQWKPTSEKNISFEWEGSSRWRGSSHTSSAHLQLNHLQNFPLDSHEPLSILDRSVF